LSRSGRSSGSPPELFADRCLGKGAPRLLIDWGWAVHLIGDHFPDDAENVSDPEWIEYGLIHGWSLLTQDARIATQDAVDTLLRKHRGSVHCLDSAELPVRTRAERSHSRQKVIYQHVRDRRTGFFVIGDAGPPRRKRYR